MPRYRRRSENARLTPATYRASIKNAFGAVDIADRLQSSAGGTDEEINLPKLRL